MRAMNAMAADVCTCIETPSPYNVCMQTFCCCFADRFYILFGAGTAAVRPGGECGGEDGEEGKLGCGFKLAGDKPRNIRRSPK